MKRFLVRMGFVAGLLASWAVVGVVCFAVGFHEGKHEFDQTHVDEVNRLGYQITELTTGQ